MTDWQEKQYNEQKRQCRCRGDENGVKTFTCANCREFDGAVEGEYETGEQTDFNA